MATTVTTIEEILKSSYQEDGYRRFLREIFDSVQLITPASFHKEYSNFSSHIEGYSHIGLYKSPENENIAMFSVQLQKGAYVESSRSTQRSYARKLIEAGNCDAAIIAFYTPFEDKWRLSFVRLDQELTFENGKTHMSTTLTPARRYSFLVGQDEPCHTAISRFHDFILNKNYNPTLKDIEEAFSVEKVTKEFYLQYCEKYHQLREHLENNEDFRIESERHHFSSTQFAKKLMGQIVFLYFLQKKGWLGVNAFPDTMNEKEYKDAFFTNRKTRELLPIAYKHTGENEYRLATSGLFSLSDDEQEILASCVKGMPWGTGPHNFMRKLFNQAIKKKKNFYDEILEPLFYDALNKNRGEQGYCPALHCRMPFLSGGLFEPIHGYDWKHNEFAIPNSVFSNLDEKGEYSADGILDIFDRYNFTMSEDEPMEREVAIDPEMLGKVFENLLDITDRKSKGAFYTPREIVHYMCQESLINYLTKELQVDENDIRDFIIYGDFMKDEDTSKDKRTGSTEMYISESLYKVDSSGKVIVNRLVDLDNALKNVRIADPAVGSGAFPVGMMNEIVRARQNISAYYAITMNSYDTRMMYETTRSPRNLKYETIKNSLFAADIEPSAVDIAQLRLWLSLVIDDEINPNAKTELDGHKNPLPLPNLECNIVCGNSLIDEFQGIKLINQSSLIGTASSSQVDMREAIFGSILDEFIKTQDTLFSCDDTIKKQQLLEKIEALKDSLLHSQLEGASEEVLAAYEESKHMASKPYVLWQIDFARVFREKGGFDIVIGNPPYIGFHNVPNKDYYNIKYFSANGKYDFYVLFIEKGIQLASHSGFISYICPSYFYKRDYGKKIRELILNNTSIKYIADFSDFQIFESALTYTCIFCLEKTLSRNNKIRILDKQLSNACAYYINQADLSESNWNIEKAEENTVLEKLLKKSEYKFGDITKSISQGIVTGFNNIYYISKAVIDSYHLEMTYFVKAYKGKDIRHGALIDNSMFLFYPYITNEKGKTIVIDEKTFKTNAPNTYNYLSARKDELLSREYFSKSKKQWYELWNPRQKQHFYNKKFVFAEISLLNDFLLVNECFYTDSACGAELQPKFQKYYNYLLLYLNSDVTTYIYKKISVPKANGYSIYKNAFLKELPIILPCDSELHLYDGISQEEFNKLIRQKLEITQSENLLIASTLASYIETTTDENE